jgi:glycosyltransferase involved in cell wall biosynthesis
LKTPLVSVCIAAYNAERYIDETIQSVLKQTYRPVELIIVNDGSTDGTAEVLRKYQQAEGISIINSDNKGPCSANNLAFRLSKGDYIKFFDADDVLNERHIEAQMARLQENPDCIVAGQVKRFYNDDLSTALVEPLATWQDLEPMDWLLIDNGKGLGMMPAWLFLIPRQLLDKAGLWDEELSLICDFEFLPRVVLQARKVLFVEEAIIFYRSGRTGSLSNNQSQAKLISAYKALEKTDALLLQLEDTPRVRAALSVFWHLWAYAFFLEAPLLYRKTKQHLKKLGNYPNVYFNNAPGRIRRVLGWKNYKRVKSFLQKLKSK